MFQKKWRCIMLSSSVISSVTNLAICLYSFPVLSCANGVTFLCTPFCRCLFVLFMKLTGWMGWSLAFMTLGLTLCCHLSLALSLMDLSILELPLILVTREWCFEVDLKKEVSHCSICKICMRNMNAGYCLLNMGITDYCQQANCRIAWTSVSYFRRDPWDPWV